MTDKSNYKIRYRSIQLNVSKKKHAKLLIWLDKLAKDEDRSLNYLITKILLMEYEKDEKKDNRRRKKVSK